VQGLGFRVELRDVGVHGLSGKLGNVFVEYSMPSSPSYIDVARQTFATARWLSLPPRTIPNVDVAATERGMFPGRYTAREPSRKCPSRPPPKQALTTGPPTGITPAHTEGLTSALKCPRRASSRRPLTFGLPVEPAARGRQREVAACCIARAKGCLVLLVSKTELKRNVEKTKMRKHYRYSRRVARSAKVYFVPLFFSKGVCAVVYGAWRYIPVPCAFI
jgi:hypothetical protein